MEPISISQRWLKSGGIFRQVWRVTGLTTIAAGLPLWALQWGNTKKFMRLLNYKVQFGVTTLFTTAQDICFVLSKAVGFATANVMSGGTQAPPGHGQKKITSGTTLLPGLSDMDDSAITDCRVAVGSAITLPVGGGFARETYPFGTWLGNALGTVGAVSVATEIKSDAPRSYPHVIQPSEGLILDNDILMGAAGIITVYVEMEWEELPLALAPDVL